MKADWMRHLRVRPWIKGLTVTAQVVAADHKDSLRAVLAGDAPHQLEEDLNKVLIDSAACAAVVQSHQELRLFFIWASLSQSDQLAVNVNCAKLHIPSIPCKPVMLSD